MNFKLTKSVIGTRILLSMLVLGILVGVITSGAALFTMRSMMNKVKTTQAALSQVLTNSEKEALLNDSLTSISALASSSAETNNLIFQGVSKEITILSDYITSLYSTTAAGDGSIPALPWDTENGVEMSRGTIVKGVEATEEVINEQKMITLAESVAKSVFDNDKVLRMVLIGTESGVFYRYSSYNDYAENYDPRTRGWYINAMANPDTVVWSDAYIEAYGNCVVTCSMTFRDAEGNIAGVLCSDVEIKSILQSILSTDPDSDYYAFVLNSDGKYIAHPDYQLTGFDRDPVIYNGTSAQGYVDDILSNESGIYLYKSGNGNKYITYDTIDEMEWKLAIVVSEDAILKTSTEEAAIAQSYYEKSQAELEKMRQRSVNVFIIIDAVTIVLAGIGAFVVAKGIKEPLDELTKSAQIIGMGSLDYRIRVKKSRHPSEIDVLAYTINKMAEDIGDYVKKLGSEHMARQKMAEENARIGTELNVATKIQADMLPSIFPAFPKCNEFDLYAKMHPAKEVGGDFYDFYMLDDRRLALVMADVSGKGVPAALFMVISKTLLKNEAHSGKSPADILTNVNKLLCENNKQEMFVTVWLGIIDIKTGKMTCSSAGHEFPFIKRSGGKFEVFHDKHGFVLGGMDLSKYRDYEIELGEGDAIFVYTDGVAEAKNSSDELFGLARETDALNKNPDASPEEILKNVQDSIDQFVGDAPQFDDITMLCYVQNKIEKKEEKAPEEK